MKKPYIFVAMAGALALSACATDDYGRQPVYGPGAGPQYESGRQYNKRQQRRTSQRTVREHRLGNNDRIYRDRNGQYYCKKSDGTTGAIVGALGGGVLGNVIAPGGSKTLGTILGAGGGLLAGRAIDRNNVRCK